MNLCEVSFALASCEVDEKQLESFKVCWAPIKLPYQSVCDDNYSEIGSTFNDEDDDGDRNSY